MGRWSARLVETGARGLLVLAGSERWAEAAIQAVTAHRGRSPWVIAWDERIEGVLGQEADLVHLPAHRGLDVDRLAAASGTVRAGGILILTVPSLADWSSANDEAVHRLLSYGCNPGDYGDRFLARLRRLLAERAEAWLLTPDSEATLPISASPSAPSTPPDDPECATPDQAAAVAAVQQLAHGRARRPLIIAADRGRGKSTALGLAAQRLRREDPERQVLVTAPQRSNAARLLEPAGVPFEAPDELLRQGYLADVLLVDEAAGIPIPLLLALSRRFNRVVFATTVHGYEGTGRGFARRFDEHLRAAGQHPHRLTLEQPIRWRPDDPLEAFLAEALLLDAEPPESADDVRHVAPLDRDRLVADEAQLRALFGLLVSAHYRTRPADLRQMLDAPELAIHAALDNAGRPLGVAITADEGPLPEALHEPVWLGERRVRGHLTAQSLATHGGQAEAAALAYRRILRIAVGPEQRRQGIGSRLIAAIAQGAAADGCDAVAASFGATAALMPFWRINGLWPVRLGHRRDRASGTHSAIVLRALSTEAEALGSRLRTDLHDQLAHHLPGGFRDLEPGLVWALAVGLPAPEPDERDWWAIAAFASGQRSRLDAMPALTRLTWATLTDTNAIESGDPAMAVLITAILQQIGEVETAQRLELSGKRACDQTLRQAFHRLTLQRAPPRIGAFMAARRSP